MTSEKNKNGKVQLENEATHPSAWKRAILDVLQKSAAARQELAEGEVVLEDRHHKPVAVVLDYQHFTAMVEKLEDLLDAQSAREALDALRRGDEETIPWETVKANLRAEGLLDE